MAIWSVSRVAPLHASPIDEYCNPPVDICTAAEPKSGVGIPLFWATIVAVILGLVLPLILGQAFQSAPHPAPDLIARASIVSEPTPTPSAMAARKLPKAQPPPPEFMQNRPRRLASEGEE